MTLSRPPRRGQPGRRTALLGPPPGACPSGP